MSNDHSSISRIDSFIKRIIGFSESGFFFILLGGGILYAGYLAQGDNAVHSSFTFILVVLGIAVLLFGTGTQGVGTLNSGGDSSNAPYIIKASLAGGAGLLAIAIGYGILHEQADIRTAFETREELYLVPIVVREGDGRPLNMENFIAEAEVRGEQRPVYRERDQFVVLVRKTPNRVEDMKINLRIYPRIKTDDYAPEILGHHNLKQDALDPETAVPDRGHGFRRVTKDQILIVDIRTTPNTLGKSTPPNSEEVPSNVNIGKIEKLIRLKNEEEREEIVVPLQ